MFVSKFEGCKERHFCGRLWSTVNLSTLHLSKTSNL